MVGTKGTSSSRILEYKFQLPASGLSCGYKLRSCTDKGEHLLAALGLDTMLLAGSMRTKTYITTEVLAVLFGGLDQELNLVSAKIVLNAVFSLNY